MIPISEARHPKVQFFVICFIYKGFTMPKFCDIIPQLFVQPPQKKERMIIL